jgi:hypothetical protein
MAYLARALHVENAKLFLPAIRQNQNRRSNLKTQPIIQIKKEVRGSIK